jgi:hypothetical protein
MKVAWNDRAPPGFITGHALGHDWRAIDLDTGRDVGDDVTWADDEAGLYEVVLRDARGGYMLTPDRDGVEREVRAARLRIVPPPGKEELVAGLSDAAAVRPDVVVAGGGPG